MKSKARSSVIRSMFWQAFLTASIIELAAVGSGFIDGIVISKMLGEASMAAEGIAHPFFSIAGVVSGLLAVGMQSICSSALARGQIKDMRNTFSMVSIVALAVSALLSVVLFTCSEQVAWLLGKWIDGIEQGDACKNIGIKMVAKTAKDVKYVSLLNTNTVIITI